MLFQIGIGDRHVLYSLDAGGTKTYAAVMDHDKNILFSVKNGQGNVAVDREETQHNIMDAIKVCMNSEYGSKCEFIVLGVAGIEKGNSKLEFKQLVEEQFQIPTFVLNDAELALYSVLGDENGILAIAGTGSVFIGKNKSTIKIIGGWGHLLGDEGSSYDIGIQALKRLISEIEQGSIQKEFATSLAGEYQLWTPSAIKDFVYSSTKKEIAELSLFVHQLAKNKDIDAIRLLENAGYEIAQQVIRLTKLLRLEPPITIVLKGGLLEKNEFIQKYVEIKLKEFSTDMSLLFRNTPAVTGSLYAWKSQIGG
ncbi:BadF/BadG/BcrA/BcrD ATPase family protein [Virgibacillus proomii]|uniref:BadF/BadG/BcrA/BcrD ATPase family protein n=1 Tax=Virgibacillus proomii TaxID=84407 RepID=UPI0009852F38|nr:BadF/BadG/BcrA/BcrD ATPase family protein [Virgibacillus proomii]